MKIVWFKVLYWAHRAYIISNSAYFKTIDLWKSDISKSLGIYIIGNRFGGDKEGFDFGGKEEKGATSSTEPSKAYNNKI